MSRCVFAASLPPVMVPEVNIVSDTVASTGISAFIHDHK